MVGDVNNAALTSTSPASFGPSFNAAMAASRSADRATRSLAMVRRTSVSSGHDRPARFRGAPEPPVDFDSDGGKRINMDTDFIRPDSASDDRRRTGRPMPVAVCRGR